MIVAGTGHRPDNLIGGYDYYTYSLEVLGTLTSQLLDFLKPEMVHIGGALGFDTALWKGCVYSETPYKVFVPFLGQDSKWSVQHRKTYKQMLDGACDVVYTKEYKLKEYHEIVTALQQRNIDMIQGTDLVLGLWSGLDGGTKNCIDSCKERKISVHNLWNLYKVYMNNHMNEQCIKAKQV